MAKTATKIDVKKLQEAIEAYLIAHQWNFENRFYSAEEWQERGEYIGRESVLTMTMDGCPLNPILNFYSGAAIFDEVHAALEEIGKRFGVNYELGFSWSIHWYEAAY